LRFFGCAIMAIPHLAALSAEAVRNCFSITYTVTMFAAFRSLRVTSGYDRFIPLVPASLADTSLNIRN
jgi:hypothetical protein